MRCKATFVHSSDELVLATSDDGVNEIVVESDLADLPPLKLLPRQHLRSASNARSTLRFRDGMDGVQLSSGSAISDLALVTTPAKRAVWNDCEVDDLGTISLRAVRAVGRVQILARDKVRKGHIDVSDLDVVSADARDQQDRPHVYGVSVLQGAFTLWNMQQSEEVVLTADLVNLSVGRFGAPVVGSGVFVSGASDTGGWVHVQRLVTRAIHVDGRIAPATADLIGGGVFVVYGAHVDTVVNGGPVATYGANDMALDNWGVVDRWVAKEAVTTRGSSAIGFVNFGSIRDLRVKAPIETFGEGARGFNVYSGTVDRAEFDRIVTHGDGAVAVQIGQPIGTIRVRRGIETFGREGQSLVKGSLRKLSSIGLSITAAGSAQVIEVNGGLKTHGESISPLEQRGTVQRLIVDGGFGRF